MPTGYVEVTSTWNVNHQALPSNVLSARNLEEVAAAFAAWLTAKPSVVVTLNPKTSLAIGTIH